MPIIYSTKPLRKRVDNDYYPTPIEFCRAAISILPDYKRKDDFTYVLDPGAGDGVWGRALREFDDESVLMGIEIRDVKKPIYYDEWLNVDFPKIEFFKNRTPFDLVIGNPPFKLAEEFLDASLRVVNDGGYVGFLYRLAFLESIRRYNKYYNNGLNPYRVYVSARRVGFEKNRKGSTTAYGFFIWKKGYTGPTYLEWLDWNYD